MENTTVHSFQWPLASGSGSLGLASPAAALEQGREGQGQDYIPTGFSLISDWALVFAADMAAGDGPAKVPKNRERKEVMVTVLRPRGNGCYRSRGEVEVKSELK